MNYLLINGLLWKAVSYDIPIFASHIIIAVSDRDLSALRNHLPVLTYPATTFYPNMPNSMQYASLQPPTPFELGVALGDMLNIVSKFTACVDCSGQAWAEFVGSMDMPTREWDIPPMHKLPLNLTHIWDNQEGNLCS